MWYKTSLIQPKSSNSLLQRSKILVERYSNQFCQHGGLNSSQFCCAGTSDHCTSNVRLLFHRYVICNHKKQLVWRCLRHCKALVYRYHIASGTSLKFGFWSLREIIICHSLIVIVILLKCSNKHVLTWCYFIIWVYPVKWTEFIQHTLVKWCLHPQLWQKAWYICCLVG